MHIIIIIFLRKVFPRNVIRKVNVKVTGAAATFRLNIKL